MKILKLFILVFTISLTLHSQNSISPYHSQNSFLFTSPGAFKFGLNGYDNPALLSYLHQPDLMLYWSDEAGRWNDFNRWGLFAGVPNMGFGMIQQKIGGNSVADYRFSFATGNKDLSFGFAYGWSSGDVNAFNRKSLVTVGTLTRPNPYVSIGLIGTQAINSNHQEGVIDVAGRPFGDERVTLFVDYAIQNKQNIKNGLWSTGVAIEPIPGIRLTGRYFDNNMFTVGFQFSLGRIGISTQSHFDKNRKYSYNDYGLRVGAYDRTVVGTSILAKKKYAEFDMNGRLKYQRFKLFDKSNTLVKVLEQIDAAKDDQSITGIAINTSGMVIGRELLWEVREKLKKFKSTGKKVVIFIDNLGIDGYHFATIADKIVMDPLGILALPGYMMGRTYVKGTLEKLGIGFDEWRFFDYKSALESFSRDKMSDADREQRQKLIDDTYKLTKSEIIEGRNFTDDKFEQIINEKVIFLAEEAQKEGLVDSLGRWDNAKDILKSFSGEDVRIVKSNSLANFNLPKDNYWGERPKIAVIYALGACAMDEGITARKLIKDVQAAAKNPKIKAVILRVDSPGGDAMASDYIAEAIKKCREKKPVIVSQGAVAASGGYWLSMYGDTIVAAPNTITGSIGVIGGWYYNKGLMDTLGFSTDLVKVGKYADLGFGATIPLIGISLPNRKLTLEEREKVENLIRSAYKGFIVKVASGRDMKTEDIEKVAQGRVWSGYDGKKLGLIDELGGLETAIEIAKVKAGIPLNQVVSLVEYPEQALIDIGFLQPKLFGVNINEDPYIEQLKYRIKNNGKPMPMLPLDYLEVIEY